MPPDFQGMITTTLLPPLDQNIKFLLQTANVQELVSDLVKKAKEIDSLIEVLPGINQTEDEQVSLHKLF